VTRIHPHRQDDAFVSMTMLVTGSSSPLGRYILDTLGDQGAHVVGDSHTPSSGVEPGQTPVGPRIDLPWLLHVMREHRVEGLVHAVEVADPCLSIEIPVTTVTANVENVLHLFEAARLTGIGGRIVLLSSATVYGDNPGRIDEASPLRPRTPYAVTKVTAEQLGKIYADLYRLDVVVLRLGEIYGPELAAPSFLQALLLSAVTGKTFNLPAGATHTFHLTHGEDISRAVLLALRAREPLQRVYNITGGERYSLAQIAGLIRSRFPQSRIEIGPGPLPGFDRQGPLDIRAADRELGYRPLWGLARGLDDYAEWYLARRAAA
jgi:UDP-glucose 4-epimerase